jgi:hypothetical protein
MSALLLGPCCAHPLSLRKPIHVLSAADPTNVYVQGLERRLARHGQGSIARALTDMPEEEQRALMRSIKPFSFQKVKAILQKALDEESQVNQEHIPLGIGTFLHILSSLSHVYFQTTGAQLTY